MLNTALRVRVQNRTSLVEATFIPAAFNAYSENLKNSGATNRRTIALRATHSRPGGDSNQKRSRNGFYSPLSFVKSYSQPKAGNHGSDCKKYHFYTNKVATCVLETQRKKGLLTKSLAASRSYSLHVFKPC